MSDYPISFKHVFLSRPAFLKLILKDGYITNFFSALDGWVSYVHTLKLE